MNMKSASLAIVFLLSLACESGVAQVYRVAPVGGFGYGGGYGDGGGTTYVGGGYSYSGGVRTYGIHGYGTGYQAVSGVRIVPVYYRVPVYIIRNKSCGCETTATSPLRIPAREQQKTDDSVPTDNTPPEPAKPKRESPGGDPERTAVERPEIQKGNQHRPRQPIPEVRGEGRRLPQQDGDRPEAGRRRRRRKGQQPGIPEQSDVGRRRTDRDGKE